MFLESLKIHLTDGGSFRKSRLLVGAVKVDAVVELLTLASRTLAASASGAAFASAATTFGGLVSAHLKKVRKQIVNDFLS